MNVLSGGKMNKSNKKLRKFAEIISVICGGLLISLPGIPQTVTAQQTTAQQTTPRVNPCPRIFYEEPHNNRVLVPQGCPPNAFTQKQGIQGQTSIRNVPASPSASQIQQDVGGEGSSSNSQSSIIQSGQGTSTSSQSQSYSTSVQRSQDETNPANEPTGGYTSGKLSNSESSTVTPSLREQGQTAIAMVMPINGKVTVRLVNQTGAQINYQAIGDTAPRSLQSKSDVTLQGLRTPTTVTFRRQDGGLLMVTAVGSSNQGVLELTLRETVDFAMDKTTVTIEQNGAAYLN
jgi:hypothetical protein